MYISLSQFLCFNRRLLHSILNVIITFTFNIVMFFILNHGWGISAFIDEYLDHLRKRGIKLGLHPGDTFSLQLHDGLKCFDLDFSLHAMELHLLFHDLFLDSALHAAHARVSLSVFASVFGLRIPQHIRLLLLNGRVESLTEGIGKFSGLGVWGGASFGQIRLDQVIEFL